MKRHSLERDEIEEKHELRQVTQLEDLMWAVRWWEALGGQVLRPELIM